MSLLHLLNSGGVRRLRHAPYVAGGGGGGGGGGPNDRYVRLGATGANDGSDWDNAWTSFSSVTNANVAAGAVVWVAGGNYGAVTLNIQGTAGSRKTIRKATVANHGTDDGWSAGYDTQVVFDGGGGAGSRALTVRGCDYVTFDGQTRSGLTSGYGIKCRNAFVAVDAVQPTGELGNDGMTFRYMEITTSPLVGFPNHEDGIQGEGNDLLVEYCYLHSNDNSTDGAGGDGTHGDGIQWFFGDNIVIRYNVFWNNGQTIIFGLGIEDFENTTGNASVYYNLFYNRGNSGGAGDQHYYGMACNQGCPRVGSTLHIYNNTWDLEAQVNDGFNNVINLVTSAGGRGTTLLKNNAFRDTACDSADNVTTNTNNAYVNSGAGICFTIPTSETGRVVGTSAQFFVDGGHATTPNYHLAASSPLIGAGTNVSSIAVDGNGQVRDLDGDLVSNPSTPDIGCFQS